MARTGARTRHGGMSSNASVTTTSNLSRDERAKIIQEKRAAASASLPTTPPREVNGNFLSATIDVTSPYDDDGKFDDDGITPLATIVEENNDNDEGYGTKYSSVAAAAATAKHGDDDEEEDDDVSNKDADYLDEDYVPDDDADDHDKDGGEEDIISQVQKRSAATLPFSAGEWQGDNNDNDEEDEYADDDNGGGKCPSLSRFSSGLYYPDDADDKLLDDNFNEDYANKHYSSIPNDKPGDTWRYRVLGGPHLSANATSAEKDKHTKERKAYTDKTRRDLFRLQSKIESKISPSKEEAPEFYTGNQTKSIRLMAIVETCPLMVGHSFRDKEQVMLRIAEEANFRNIRVKVQKSCTMKYEVAGHNFFVSASKGASGWIICIKVCQDEDDPLQIPAQGLDYNKKSLRSPFTGLWLSKILLPHLELCPGMTYR